ncbi:MAG TPA: hypothetical protein VMR52_11850 [Dehalococcoidia bacterium]|nr:hypothetical protein [Dehalococcoidia bacterium]
MRYIAAAYAACLTFLSAIALIGAVVLFEETGPDSAAEAAADRHAFNFVTWELEKFPQKWLYKIGDAFRDDEGNDDEVLRRYFALSEEINRLAAEDPASGELADATDERRGLEARVEDIIEGRVTSILEEEGMALRPPIFSDLGIIFPPVDFELDEPVRVLAVSARDRIQLEGSHLLSPGLDRETALDIESEVEAEDEGVSALVVVSGGVATYPATVNAGRSYESLIDTVFHEWLHHYLAFFPLGRSYFEGDEARTLNESAANIGGREFARLYFEKYGPLNPPPPTPSPEPSPTPEPEPPSGEEPFDLTAAMRALRVEVEALLADEEVEEAETLMEEKRQEFEGEGYFIRRLNQAYFAFYGFYADTGASIDPIGPNFETLLERSETPGEFVRTAQAITSRAELEALLAAD